MSKNRISDEELVAFLDGQLRPDRAAEIREHTWGDADTMTRVCKLALDRAALKHALDGLIAAAPAATRRKRFLPFV